jgi:hypothetical protein
MENAEPCSNTAETSPEPLARLLTGLTPEQVVTFAETFADDATDALTSGDDAEVFNAALAFAGRHGLSSAAMARVLVAVRQQRGRGNTVSVSTLRSWVRDAREALGENKSDAFPDRLVNTELQLHAAGATDWAHAERAAELTAWFHRLNGHFFAGQLPPAPISFETESAANLGWYRLKRDGLALKHRINLNALYVGASLCQNIAVLLHEMLHLWEDAIHGRRVGGSYHTKRFRERAEELGIPTTENGEFLGIQDGSQLARFLAEHKVSLEPGLCGDGESSRDPRRGPRPVAPGSRLQAWTCGCDMRVWASIGRELRARCHTCGQAFERATTSARSRRARRRTSPEGTSLPSSSAVPSAD